MDTASKKEEKSRNRTRPEKYLEAKEVLQSLRSLPRTTRNRPSRPSSANVLVATEVAPIHFDRLPLAPQDLILRRRDLVGTVASVLLIALPILRLPQVPKRKHENRATAKKVSA